MAGIVLGLNWIINVSVFFGERCVNILRSIFWVNSDKSQEKRIDEILNSYRLLLEKYRTQKNDIGVNTETIIEELTIENNLQ